MSGGDVFGEELHLLRHAALHDGVVFVEAHSQRFAVEDFLVDLVLPPWPKLGRRRRTCQLRLEVGIHDAKVVQRDRDLPGRLDSAAASLQVSVDGKQHHSQQQEMQQRFAEPAFESARGKGRGAAGSAVAGCKPDNYGHFIHQVLRGNSAVYQFKFHRLPKKQVYTRFVSGHGFSRAAAAGKTPCQGWLVPYFAMGRE